MTSGLAGMVNASLEVVRRLQASGHRVSYACPHDVRATIERHGIDYHQLPPVNRQPAPERRRRANESRLAHKRAEWRTRVERRSAGVAALGMEALRELLGRLKPDLVLADFDLEEHVITCVTSGVRTVILSPWFEFRRCAGLPPLGSRLVGGTSMSRWAAWTSYRCRSRLRRLRTSMRYFGTDRRGVVEEYARRTGFPASDLWGHDWSTLFAFDSVPVWSMTAKELEFPHVQRASFSHVGPMVRLDRIEDERAADALGAMEARIGRARAAGHRVLYGSLSSMAADADRDDDQGGASGGPFVDRLVEALASRDDWVLLLGLGGQTRALEGVLRRRGKPLPSQIEVLPWAPQLEALKEADLFISHAGIHSIHEAFTMGTPTVVYSASAFDQDGCAARLAFHRAASVGSRDESSAAIAARLHGALADESLRIRTREVRGLFSASGGALDAAVASVLKAVPIPDPCVS
ncbi:MurG-like transferase [Planctomycetes bacterium Poly30]|uniref:MurG-like transferase n=1 Tax=Saltatorellus ferox TaxID=2528018 RepID=A0A518F1B2_9BACT|nr:MurG-like transferase [Planctomycetes bacterium Poly30]